MAGKLESLGPLSLAVAAVRQPRQALSAMLPLAGVALLSGTPAGGDLAAACGWALYIVASGHVGGFERPGQPRVALAVAATATAPLTILSAPTVTSHPSTLAALAAFAVLGTVLPYGLELAALRRLAPSAAGILFSIEPAIAAIVGLVGLGQELSATEALGITAVVIAGAITLRTT